MSRVRVRLVMLIEGGRLWLKREWSLRSESGPGRPSLSEKWAVGLLGGCADRGSPSILGPCVFVEPAHIAGFGLKSMREAGRGRVEPPQAVVAMWGYSTAGRVRRGRLVAYGGSSLAITDLLRGSVRGCG